MLKLSGQDNWCYQSDKQNNFIMMTISSKQEIPSRLQPLTNTATSCVSLFDKVEEVTFKKGETIFHDRNSHLYVYLVTKGMVKIFSFHDGKEMLEDYFIKGELFNCEAFLEADSRNVSSKAMSHLTTVKKVPAQLFRRSLQDNPSLYGEVLNSINASRYRSQERLRRFTLLHSDQRVIHFLADHAKKAGRQVGYEFVIRPVFTHREIGKIAGTSRQTATTVLNKLRNKNIIHFTRSYLIVRDIEALLKMVD